MLMMIKEKEHNSVAPGHSYTNETSILTMKLTCAISAVSQSSGLDMGRCRNTALRVQFVVRPEAYTTGTKHRAKWGPTRFLGCSHAIELEKHKIMHFSLVIALASSPKKEEATARRWNGNGMTLADSE